MKGAQDRGRTPGNQGAQTGPTYPLKQWAAVTAQRLVSREPAQWWVPFLWMLTTQGHSASALSSPPTTRLRRWGFPQAGGAGRGGSQSLSSAQHHPRPLPASPHLPPGL